MNFFSRVACLLIMIPLKTSSPFKWPVRRFKLKAEGRCRRFCCHNSGGFNYPACAGPWGLECIPVRQPRLVRHTKAERRGATNRNRCSNKRSPSPRPSQTRSRS